MKRILTIAVTLALMLSFAACGKKDKNPDTTGDTSTAESTVQTTPETTTEDTSVETEESTTGATEESTAGTTETTKPADTTAPEAGTADPEAVLDAIWNAYADDQKFPAVGGDSTEELVEEPGSVALDADALDNVYGFPKASIDKIDAAASLMHMMNANTFTCGAYSVKDGEDVEALAKEIRENILARQWMCGFPDTLVIMTVDNTIISVFGKSFAVEPFRDMAKSVHANLTVVYDEPIE